MPRDPQRTATTDAFQLYEGRAPVFAGVRRCEACRFLEGPGGDNGSVQARVEVAKQWCEGSRRLSRRKMKLLMVDSERSDGGDR